MMFCKDLCSHEFSVIKPRRMSALDDFLNHLAAYGEGCVDIAKTETSWECGNPLEYQGYAELRHCAQIGEQCWFAEISTAITTKMAIRFLTFTNVNLDWKTQLPRCGRNGNS